MCKNGAQKHQTYRQRHKNEIKTKDKARKKQWRQMKAIRTRDDPQIPQKAELPDTDQIQSKLDTILTKIEALREPTSPSPQECRKSILGAIQLQISPDSTTPPMQPSEEANDFIDL